MNEIEDKKLLEDDSKTMGHILDIETPEQMTLNIDKIN